MKFNKKTIAIACGVILVGSLIGLGIKKAKGQDALSNMVVETVKVENQKDFKSTLEVDGIIKSKEEVSITPDISTKVVEVYFKEGDKVKKGDILARLDTKDIMNKISNAEVNLSIEKEKLKNLQTDLVKASKPSNTTELEKNIESSKINYEGSRKGYETSKQLFEAGAVTKEKMDSDERNMLSAKNAVEIAESRLKQVMEDGNSSGRSKDEIQGSIEIQMKSITLQELNLKNEREFLDKSTVRSTIDGTIITSNAEIGELPQVGSPLFAISNTDKLEAEVKVGEYDISSIKVGQKSEITGDAFRDKTLSGTVSYIAPNVGDTSMPQANAQSAGVSKETKLVVKIDLDEIYEGIKPGYNVSATINTSQKDQALVVPYESIYKKKDNKYVVFLVNKDNIVKEIPVQTGIAGDIKQEIISSKIKSGDKIIKTPDEKTKDGMKINLVDKSNDKKK